MKRTVLRVAAAAIASAFLAAGEPGESWAEGFQASFFASLEGASLAEEPGTWLQRRQGFFEKLEEAGMDSRDAGSLAATLMLSWDLDLRSGMSLQDANARLRQASAVLSQGDGRGRGQQERIIRSLRSAQGNRGASPAFNRGGAVPSLSDKGFGKR